MQEDIAALLATSLPGVALAPAHWRGLLPLCRVRKLAREGVLFTQGQATPALFGLLAGEIAIRFSTVDGDVSVVEHVPPGRLFGLSSFASGRPSTFEALATRPARVVAFGPAAYEYLMDEVPGFARALMSEFARRHDGSLRMLEASRHRSAMERLSLALEQLARTGRIERRDEAGWRFVRTTQAEVAALANLSRQTVNTLIGELAVQQRLRASYGGVWLPP
ncbi:MAG TPA: Crp/Fnr family transcriptional regulator [Burkholderiaceae bacterium]|nr:Crp/Fnr family transcriptional regulator [Burkholderiaceae bacterium]